MIILIVDRRFSPKISSKIDFGFVLFRIESLNDHLVTTDLVVRKTICILFVEIHIHLTGGHVFSPYITPGLDQ